MNGPARAAASAAALLSVLLGSITGPAPVRAEPDPLLEAGAAGYTETVTVTATRLDDQPSPLRTIPSSVTVLTREDIAASGARTIQELLGVLAGALVFDTQGNGIQTTFGMRGLAGGEIVVLLDGARVNDPRNNSVPLEAILIEGVERIEISRGPAAATVGGGSAAGVINVMTRAGGEGPLVALGGGAGSYGARRIALSAGTAKPGPGSDAALEDPARGAVSSSGSGGVDAFAAIARDTTDGFRENADARLTRFTGSLGRGFGLSRLSLSLHAADDTIGAPGSLTVPEAEDDPDRSPFNRLDRSEVSWRQATLNWRGPVRGAISLAANLSWMGRRREALTTGRVAAAGFGGFLLDSKIRQIGGAAQTTAVFHAGGSEQTLTIGGEGTSGTSEDEGCGTLTGNLDTCDLASFLNSKNETRRRDLSFFVQHAVSLGPVTLLAGGRWDRSRFSYDESSPGPSNDRTKVFTETSWKGGFAWNPSTPIGLFASFAESFTPPTVEDLFSFPGFGSNPDLEPSEAAGWEAGVRGTVLTGRTAGGAAAGRPRSLDYSISLFRTTLSETIVFDPTPVPGSPFGQNVNGGKSRREGLEAALSWRIARWLFWSAAWTRTDATFENGPNRGSTVPLVPRTRHAETLRVNLPRGADLRIDWLRVGAQVLDNDDANTQQRLDGYSVLDARLGWRPRGASRRGKSGAAGWGARADLELFLEGRNLLDETYATRGIFAFDFLTQTSRTFLTPAPGRTFFGGAVFTY